MTETMNAIVIREHGPPTVLKPEQISIPQPGFSEVQLRVKACALNHLDVWVRSGIPGIKLPLILGCDVAGEISKLGEGVNHLAVGDKVLVCPGLSCGTCKECLAGQENLCRHYHILGAGRNGGYAELVTVPAINCFPIPSGLDFHQAAAIPLVFLTAAHMLITRTQIRPGETVLIIGGGSGVGTAAIQIAKLFHSHVIATVGDDTKVDFLKSLGANEVIIHSHQSIAKEVNRLTNKRGADIIFEHVGPAVFKECLSCLAIGGRLVTCGATTGPAAEIDITRLFMKHQSILGSIMGTRRELMDILPFFANKLLKPIVNIVLPLSKAQEAHELLESRKHLGKIVLDPTQ